MGEKKRVLLRKVGFKLLSFLIWETCFIFDFSLTTCCFTSSGGLALLPSTSLTRPGFSDQPHYRRTDPQSLVEDQTSGNQISWFQRQIWSVVALLATSMVDCKPLTTLEPLFTIYPIVYIRIIVYIKTIVYNLIYFYIRIIVYIKTIVYNLIYCLN